MRLPLIVLLSLAAVLSGGASASTTTKVRSIVVNRDNVPTKRLLRSDATAHLDGKDNGEERAGAVMFDGFGTLVKPFTKIKSTFQGAAVTKLAKNYDLTGAFKYLKLDKFKSVESLHLKDVDKLFASKKFNLWSAYIPRWNKQHSNEPYSVAKMFSQELGATKALDVFAVASTSKNPKVVQMGNNFQGQLLREFSRAGDDFDRIALQLGEGKAGNMFYNAIKSTSDSDSKLGERYAAKLLTKWATEGKNHDDVVKMVPSLGDSYTNMLLSLAIRANGRANDEAKIAAAAKKAVAAVTPV